MMNSLLENYAWICLVVGLIAFLCLDGVIARIVHGMCDHFQQESGWDRMFLARHLAGLFMFIWICIGIAAGLSDLRTLGQSVCVGGLFAVVLGAFLVSGKMASNNSLFAKVTLVTLKLFFWIILIAISGMDLVEKQPLSWIVIMVLGVMALMLVLYMVTPANKKCENSLPCHRPRLIV